MRSTIRPKARRVILFSPGVGHADDKGRNHCLAVVPGVTAEQSSVPTPALHSSSTSHEGTKKLALSASNWLSCLAFPTLYLISIFVGAGWDTALIRGIVGALAIRFCGPWLFYLLVDTVMSALTESKLDKKEGDES